MRIAIDTGPVVVGVIGIAKFIYDQQGDTVNTPAAWDPTSSPAPRGRLLAACYP